MNFAKLPGPLRKQGCAALAQSPTGIGALRLLVLGSAVNNFNLVAVTLLLNIYDGNAWD